MFHLHDGCPVHMHNYIHTWHSDPTGNCPKNDLNSEFDQIRLYESKRRIENLGRVVS